MSTPFSFETIFRAPSVQAVLEAYFDPDHLAAQDAVAKLTDRTIVEERQDDRQRFCTWSVRALTQLPLYARPFVEGGRLAYLETMTWRKPDDEIDLTIKPQILGGRVQIAAVYKLTAAGDGQVKRRYSGTISVDVKLISGKIERGILTEIENGMPTMRDCTQAWLLRKYPT